MKRIDFENNITLYINDELSNKEKKDFENAMIDDPYLKNLFKDILYNDQLLKNLPKVSVSNDFVNNLNSKIDDYNKVKDNNWFRIIENLIPNIKPAPAFSIAGVTLIVCFSIIKIYDYDLFPNFLESKKYNVDLNNYIAVNDSDSLSSVRDSLDNTNLLFGND